MPTKKFIRYKDYSGTTLDKLFTEEQKKGMDIYKTNFFESGVLLNEGNMTFKPLNIAQSGFYTPGNIRTIKKLTLGKKQGFVVVENNGFAKLLKLNN